MRRVSLARLADRRTPPQALRGLGVSIRYATVQSSQESLSLLGRAGRSKELTWPYVHVGEPSPHVARCQERVGEVFGCYCCGPAFSFLPLFVMPGPFFFFFCGSCPVLSTNCTGRKTRKLRHTQQKCDHSHPEKKKRFF